MHGILCVILAGVIFACRYRGIIYATVALKISQLNFPWNFNLHRTGRYSFDDSNPWPLGRSNLFSDLIGPHSDRFKIFARSLTVFMKKNSDICMLLRRWDGYVPRIRRYYRWAIAESPTRPVSSSPWRTPKRRTRRNRGKTKRPLGSCISGRWRRPTVAATCANSTPNPCWASWDAWMS